MSLFEEAKAIYAEKNLDFEQDLVAYSAFGYTYVTPNCIILAEVQQDCWFVQFALGRGCIEEFLRVMPFRLKYVSWMRGLRSNQRRKVELTRMERIYVAKTK